MFFRKFTTETLSITRKRLQYQMRKRGILETDLLLSTFAHDHLDKLDSQELRDLDTVLGHVDWDIFYWATGKTKPPENIQQMSVFQRLQQHATSTQSKGINRMPDLT